MIIFYSIGRHLPIGSYWPMCICSKEIKNDVYTKVFNQLTQRWVVQLNWYNICFNPMSGTYKGMMVVAITWTSPSYGVPISTCGSLKLFSLLLLSYKNWCQYRIFEYLYDSRLSTNKIILQRQHRNLGKSGVFGNQDTDWWRSIISYPHKHYLSNIIVCYSQQISSQ